MTILLIDNYDSFTWNLVQRFGEIDPSIDLRVARNDRITLEEVEAMRPAGVVISPGPCTPNEAGISNEVIRRFAGRVPILGVCLGHQCMGQMSGMPVRRHWRIVHGKTSLIHHDARGVFEGLANPFIATRYHSLVVEADDAAADAAGCEISAWTQDTDEHGRAHRVVMGLRRRARRGEAPMEGVQFHPESFLTAEGPKLLENFLRQAQGVPTTAA